MANAKLGTKAVGSIVKLNVNGTAKEFIVVHQGLPSSMYDESCDGTWLLMKDIYEKKTFNSSNLNAYETSEVNTYLNGPFFSLFDSNIQGIIKQVKIPHVKNGVTQSGANGLSCKVFLLSGYEVGFTTSDNSYFPVDGAKLDYFTASSGGNSKRIAYLNGSATIWWLRSPYTYNSQGVWTVTVEGTGTFYNAFDYLGIRPCIILPSTTLVDDSGNVVIPNLTAHKTLINGTAYTVKGGKCLVNGTVYNILKGRTLIDGTGWDITFPSAEPDVSKTWVFNSILSAPDTAPTVFYANFTSGGSSFKAINADVMAGALSLSYLFLNQDATHTQMGVYYYGWKDASYRTVTFDEAPSGDLLTWLQANATPQ